MTPRQHPRARAPVRALLVCIIACAVAGVVVRLSADAALSQREADSLHRKILSIQQFATTSLPGARLTPVSEAELNSYIRFALSADLPAGVVEPYIGIVGNGEVHGRAVVDLDAVRRAKPRGWLDPLAYISGRVPVTTAGRLVAQDGAARFEFWTATVAGVGVPKAVLDELVAFYTRSEASPRGLSLDDTFDLPARIAEITVEPGRAILIQR